MRKYTVLAFPNFDKPFIIYLDASDIALGATLSQKDANDELKLVACMSKKLQAAELNYPLMRKNS